MDKRDWVWMPHAAHLIVGDRCAFHLATYVGGVVVSTVGEWKMSGSRDADKFEEIGLGRLYETMVFRAEESKHECCPWVQATGEDVDFDAYNDPADAYRGHIAMCEKWSFTGAEAMA